MGWHVVGAGFSCPAVHPYRLPTVHPSEWTSRRRCIASRADLCCPPESVEPEYCCTKSMPIGDLTTHSSPNRTAPTNGREHDQSRTTDCRRHDAGNTTGGAERPWRAPTHGSTHVSTGHVAEGGTSIACTMTRGSWRWERHIAPRRRTALCGHCSSDKGRQHLRRGPRRSSRRNGRRSKR